ncbi:hypothetical protein ANN_14528 [Periplaneta americana]|uniref:Uncharacterized protein n=1 Tax=Periplaneta americana TaxID=6978 RepID=A0ABQ8SWL1_PERAM|nr:hypothetical protein ANN_14528 [Periplaneta americana]
MGESRNAYRVLVGGPEGKRPLGRPRRRWEDNIKMDLREVGYDDRDWINLAQDRDRWRAYGIEVQVLVFQMAVVVDRYELEQLLSCYSSSNYPASPHHQSNLISASLRLMTDDDDDDDDGGGGGDDDVDDLELFE